ncbi:phenylpyruvate tautomerase MIF-related protein [Telmatospirillum siberiense]|uniref:L-dopachrome isomerase n=1 Tax=Telmatospirillum siberiense TaxID=382514 RepID=A0A2N3PXR6_9PROT|nr:phenylpyruvate tautomerase MIF-related protein [Telmatospirillum siberiense]PKU25203.1 hypothetical protein CWS72_07475 [Telmatospirillum siberiense]
MPLIRVASNRQLETTAETPFAKDLSTFAARLLGKPERYVMVHLQMGQTMVLGGTDEPLANVEVQSIGLPTARTGDFSKALCDFLEKRLEIAPSRVYIQFTAVPGELWGWNGATF